ncbi:hypothetical protein Tco_0680655 [Tanacetum coccineum]|uniref:Uncharacterized protein n=1 Tax=Tanacetum coccineum TaxID=301880 RepID=A0ABQ4XMK0_9ASTR
MSLPGNPQLSLVCCVWPSTALNVMHRQEDLGKDNDNSLEELLQEYKDVFQVPSHLPAQKSFDHAIPLKDPSTTVRIWPYRYPPAQKDEIEKMLKNF